MFQTFNPFLPSSNSVLRFSEEMLCSMITDTPIPIVNFHPLVIHLLGDVARNMRAVRPVSKCPLIEWSLPSEALIIIILLLLNEFYVFVAADGYMPLVEPILAQFRLNQGRGRHSKSQCPLAIDDMGYTYSKANNASNCWRCSKKNTNCKARIKTDNEWIVAKRGIHTCTANIVVNPKIIPFWIKISL